MITKQTNSTKQNPALETNRSSASQEIPHILRKMKVHSCKSKLTPPVPTRSQIGPVHTPSHLLNAHFKLINPSKSRSPK